MFTTVNNNKYPKIYALDTIHVKKQQITARYWNDVHGHKGFVAA